MRPFTLNSLLVAGALGVSAFAAGPAPAQVQDRVITIYGNDRCPADKGQEIVVCKHAPESERYRIPQDLRESAPSSQALGGGAVAAVNTTGGTGVQVQSCNAIGAGVNAGCLTDELSAWKADQVAQKKAAANAP